MIETSAIFLKEVKIMVEDRTYQSPLLRPSPLALRGSRLEPWPAAADAKLEGMCEGIIDRWLARDITTENSCRNREGVA